LPGTYTEVAGEAFSPWVCVGLFVMGIGLVLLLENFASADENPDQQDNQG